MGVYPGIKEFNDAIQKGKLTAYHCTTCGYEQVGIAVFCAKCGKSDMKTVDAPSEGTVVTYTIQFVAPEPFLNEVPYAWVIVQLDGGLMTTGWIPMISSPKDLAVGQRVRIVKTYKPGILFQKIS